MSFTKGQIVRQPLTIRYAGLGAYSQKFADIFSSTSNQASLAQLQGGAFGVYGERRFLLEELNQFSAIVAMPTTEGTFALQGDYFGFSSFNENQLGLAYGRKISRQMDIGIKFNYHTVQVSGYGNASAINFEAGTIFHLTEKLHAGVHAYNPLSSRFGNNNNERLASLYRIGFGYEASEKVFLSGEIVKQENLGVSVNAGLQYNVTGNVFLRTGISTLTNNTYAGVGLKFGFARVDLNAAYHPQLGVTPGLLLLFNLKRPVSE
jgi:opacity protein-like surface antigen